MNLSWSNRVIKYVLFGFNLLFVISGIILIAVGVSVKEVFTQYNIILNDSYFSLPNLLIATGSLIFFISFFGCCGALKESWLMIFIFSFLLALIFILEFSAGIAGYVLRDKTNAFLNTALSNAMANYEVNKDNPNSDTIMWDSIQYEFLCCGVNGPGDWSKYVTPVPPKTRRSIRAVDNGTESSTPSSPTPDPGKSSTSEPSTSIKSTTVILHTSTNSADVITNQSLPGSCCKSKAGATGILRCTTDPNVANTDYYRRGCVEGFGAYLKDHAVTIGAVGITIAFIQLFAVIFACHLSKQIKHGFYST